MMGNAAWEPFRENTMGHRMWNKKTELQRYIYSRVELAGTQMFLVGLLLLSLFITDAWILGNQPNSNDDAVHGVLLAIFILFCIECLTLSLVQPLYLSTIFFFLDVLGTVSIIIDIPWIATRIGIPQGGGTSNGAVLRSTRAAKLGTRYGRLMRILKLTRFLRFMPCFKQAGEEMEPALTQVRRVTTVLVAKLSQNVAAVIMILVIVVPFLSYNPPEIAPGAWIQSLKLVVKQNTTTMAQLTTHVNKIEHFYQNQLPRVMGVTVSSPYLTPAPAQPRSWAWTTRSVVRSQNVIVYKSYFKPTTISQVLFFFYS